MKTNCNYLSEDGLLKIVGFVLTFHFLVFQPFNCIAQWQQFACPDTTGISAIAVKGSKIFCTTSGEGVFFSNDSGATWSQVNNGLIGSNMQQLFSLVIKENIVYVGAYLDIYMSSNDGINWVPSNATNGSINSLFVSGNNIYAVAGGSAGGGRAYVSNDNGVSWNIIAQGIVNGGIYSVTTLGNKIFLGTAGASGIGGIFMSSNNGSNWVLSGLSNMAVLSMVANNYTIFASTNGGIYTSTDTGSNWIVSNNGLPSLFIRRFAVSDNNVFVTTSGGVSLSTNNGTSWVNINGNLVNSNYAYSLYVDNGYLYVSLGNSVARRSISEILTSLTEPKNGTEITIYPNPATSKLYVQVEDFQREAEILVYNINSQLVQKQILQNKTVEIDISGLTPGLYFVKVQTALISRVWKIIKE